MASKQPKYTKNKDEADIAKEIDEQYLFAKRYLDPIHKKFNLLEELYRSFIDQNNYPHGARVFDPRIFRIIETVTPRMVATEPSGSFYPTEEGDESTTHILNALMKYDWRRADMFQKQVMFIKSMLIFGTAFGRTHWDFREKEKTQMVAKKVNGRMIWSPENKKKINITEFDGPNFEVLNIYDCFPDPNATNMDNMRWFIYRTFKTIDELKSENDARGAEYWKNLDELEKAIGDKQKDDNPGRSGGKPNDITYREHRRVMLGTEDLTGQDESNPEITVLIRFTREGWCFYAPEYAGVGDFSGIIREVENPYFHGELPIVYCTDYPYPGELYGMGEIEPIDRIQRAINAVLNQRLDNVQLTLNTMWKVKKNAGVDLHTLVSAPGNIVTTDNMDAVESMQTPDVTGSTFVQTMNYLTSAMQNGSGITDYTQGVKEDSNVTNNTATGIKLIQNEANAQFKLKIQLYTHNVIKKIADHWKDLRIQYTTDAQKLRILGSQDIAFMRDNTKLSQTDMEGQPITPGDLGTQAKLEIKSDNFAFLNLLPDDLQPSIVGDFDFIPILSSEQLNDPMMMQQNFMTLLDRFNQPGWQQGLASQGKMLNFEEITKDSIEQADLGFEASKVLVDVPQQPASPPPQQMTEDNVNATLGNAQQGFEQNLQQNMQAMMPQQQKGGQLGQQAY